MKKKFVKVALLSVLTCGAPAMFTSCDDDGWKDRTNVLDEEMAEKGELINKLTEQTKALDTQIAQCKQEGQTAQKSADAAMSAAEKAQTAGDDAMAAAKAAEASAQLAAAAAAEAKAEAAEALKKQYDELIALISANTNEIAANKALIEGNKALIEQYKGLIDGNTVKINDNAGAIEKILSDLKNYATSEDLKGVSEELNKKLEAAGIQATNAITELNGTVAGINAAVIALQGQADALGVKVDGIEKAMNDQLGTLESNLVAKIEAEAKLRADGDAELQSQINSLKEDISKLNLATNLQEFTKFIGETNTQLAALKAYDDKLTSDLAALASKVTAAENLIKENQNKIATLTTDLKTASDKATANAAAIAAQAILIQKNADDIATINSGINEIKLSIKALQEGDIADLQGYVSSLDAQMSVMNETLDRIVNQLSDVTPYIITMTMDQLRGLVFIPSAFVGGIESALSYNMYYYPKTAAANLPKDITWNGYKFFNQPSWNLAVQANAKEVTFKPLTEVSYHLNPTSAKVNFEDLSIVSNMAEIITRSGEENLISLNKDYGVKFNNGILTVAIEGDTKVFQATSYRPTQMPVFALQANVYSEDNDKGETVVTKVTSDYAMFSLMNITPERISINPQGYIAAVGASQGRDDNHEVWSTPQDAAQYTATAKVAWDGSIDLTQIFQINYYDSQRHESGIWTSAEEWSKFGLDFEYTLIKYTIGNEKVSESEWASISDEGVLTPHMPGKPDVQSRDELGHQPLVFVTVKDRNHNDNVVLTGFIKVLIAPTEDYYVSKAAIFNPVDFTCNDISGYENATLSGNVMQNMYDATGLTWDIFAKHYTPVTVGANPGESEILVQYTRGVDAFPILEGDNVIGDIVFAGVQADDILQAFRWDIDVQDKQKIYEEKDHTATVYVCFASDNVDVFPDLYIPLTRSVNPKPVANVESKMEARWFRNMTTALLNVQQPTNGVLVQPINSDLNLLWTGSKPTFKQVSGKPAISAATYATQNGAAGGYRYYFPNIQEPISYGNGTIKLTVSNTTNPCLIGNKKFANAAMGDHALLYSVDGNGEYNNNQIFANGKLLATIDPNTGVITYANNPDAEALLNKFASDGDGLNRTNAKLQVKVGIVAYNECGIALQLAENAIIPATFLRPINIVESPKELNFKDATANGSKVSVYDLLDFSDWRAVSFANNEWLFAYYNVKSVTVHKDKIQSNAANINSDPSKFIVDASVNAAFEFNPGSATNFTPSDVNSSRNAAIKAAIKAAFGEIVYDNTKLNINTFDVKIPMTINYGLGSFDVVVSGTVKATMGNN